MTRVKFVSTISKMGDKRIILITKDYHSHLDTLNPKQVKVTMTIKSKKSLIKSGYNNV